MFLHMIYSILSCLSLHYSQNKPKEKAPPKKRSRLQCPMKLTSSPNELSFDEHRSLYTPKAQLARTKCKLGYISLSSQIVKKLLRHS